MLVVPGAAVKNQVGWLPSPGERGVVVNAAAGGGVVSRTKALEAAELTLPAESTERTANT